jgi:hypothetical protein
MTFCFSAFENAHLRKLLPKFNKYERKITLFKASPLVVLSPVMARKERKGIEE